MVRRRSTTKPLVLGFIGNAQLEEKRFVKTMDDLTDGREVLLIVPATDVSYNDSIAMVLDWADANKIAFEVVTDATTAKDKDLKAVAGDAEKVHKAADVPLQIVQLLDSSDIDGRLLVFWEADSEGVGADDATSALEAADATEIPAYDLLRGLELFELFGDDDDDEPADEDNVPDPAPTKGRRRGAAAAAPEASDEQDDDDADDVAGDDLDIPSTADLKAMGVVALRRLAKELREASPADVKGLGKPDLIALIRGDEPDEQPELPIDDGADEAQAMRRPPAAGADATLEAAMADAVDSAITQLVKALTSLFLYEVRKPRSAGRPRKDGTAAQSRKAAAAAAAEEADDDDADDDDDEPDEAPAPRPRRRRSAS